MFPLLLAVVLDVQMTPTWDAEPYVPPPELVGLTYEQLLGRVQEDLGHMIVVETQATAIEQHIQALEMLKAAALSAPQHERERPWYVMAWEWMKGR